MGYKVCPQCGTALTDEMLEANMCWECGYIIDKSLMDDDAYQAYQEIDQDSYFSGKKVIELDGLVTSGSGFHHMRISQYLGLISQDTIVDIGEIVTNCEINGKLKDTASDTYNKKMKDAKQVLLTNAIKQMKENGGNALIGVHFTMSAIGNRLMALSLEATAVIVMV